VTRVNVLYIDTTFELVSSIVNKVVISIWNYSINHFTWPFGLGKKQSKYKLTQHATEDVSPCFDIDEDWP